MSLWRAARRKPAGDVTDCRERVTGGLTSRRSPWKPLARITRKSQATLDPATHFLSFRILVAKLQFGNGVARSSGFECVEESLTSGLHSRSRSFEYRRCQTGVWQREFKVDFSVKWNVSDVFVASGAASARR